MNVSVQCLDVPLTPAIREWAERRVQFALRQFGGRVRSVRVQLSDQNGPRGGLDQRCGMLAPVAGVGTVAVAVNDTDLYRAVARAAERISRRIRSLLDRERSSRRSGITPRRHHH